MIFDNFCGPLGIILIIIGLVFFLFGFLSFRKKRLIENTPTSKIRSLAMGLVEIYGDVIPAEGNLLISPLLKKDCVYYHYLVERYEEHYDSQTKETKGEWKTVESETKSVRFDLQDDSGKVLVDPNHADIKISKNYQTQQGDMRYSEWYIEPNEKLYILGTAGENPFKGDASVAHVDTIMIQKGKEEKQYLISDKSEKQILRGLAFKTYALWSIGIVFIVLGAILFLRLM